MRRTLRLTKETLSELTPHELGVVAAGALTPGCPPLPSDYCASGLGCVSKLIYPCLTYTCVCV